jgi:hypothetical protein
MSINNYSLKGISSSVQYGKNGGIFDWDSNNNYFSLRKNSSQYSKILLNNILLEEDYNPPDSIIGFATLYSLNDSNLYVKFSNDTIYCLTQPNIDFDDLVNNPWSISGDENDCYSFLNVGINRSDVTSNYNLDVNGSILTKNIDINNILKIKNVYDTDPSYNSIYSQIYGKTDGKIYLKNSQGIVFCLTEPTVNIDNIINNPWSISGDENDVFTNLNLGIGNTDPQSILHVTNNNTNSNSNILRLETKSTSDSTTKFVEFYDNDTMQGKITGDSGNAIVYSTTSDERLKENIKDTNINGSEVINKIRVRDFQWKKNKEGDIGLIAQELREVYPKAVFGKEDEEFLTIEKQSLVPILIKTLQEVIKKNNKLEERLKRIEEKLL